MTTSSSRLISSVITVYDENRHFLGELTEGTGFVAELPPGKHRLIGAILEGGAADRYICRRISADLAPGKIYVAMLMWRDSDSGSDRKWRAPSQTWVFPHPGDKQGIAVEPSVYRMQEPDLAKGQDFLDRGKNHELFPSANDDGPCASDRLFYEDMAAEVAATKKLPADWGFDVVPTP